MPKHSDISNTNSNSNTNIPPPKSSRKRRSEIELLEQQSNKSELTQELVLDNIIEEKDISLNSPVTRQNIKRRKEGSKELTDDLRCEEEFNEGDSPSQSMSSQNTGIETTSRRKKSSDDREDGISDGGDSPFTFSGSSNSYHIDYDVSSDVLPRNSNIKHPPEFYNYGDPYDVIDLMYKKCEIYPKAYVTGRRMETEITYRNRITILSWLTEVAYEEQQSRITYHIAVNFFDRVLSVAKIQPSYYQLVAGACLKLASKIEEVIPLSGESIVSKAGDCFSLKQLMKTETVVTHALEFSMNPLTTLHFIDFYFRIISFTCDMQSCVTPTNLESPSKVNDTINTSTATSSSPAKVNSTSDSPTSTPSSSKSSENPGNENKIPDEIDSFLFSESPIVLQDELIHYYISAAAMADFITFTNPHLCYNPSKLAAAILYAQFADFDGYLNFSKYKKEDLEEEYEYIKPFFEQIDKIVEEYKIKCDYLIMEAQKSLEDNKNEMSEDFKYRIQTCSLLFNELLEDENLKEHIEKYQNNHWGTLNIQGQK